MPTLKKVIIAARSSDDGSAPFQDSSWIIMISCNSSEVAESPPSDQVRLAVGSHAEF